MDIKKVLQSFHQCMDHQPRSVQPHSCWIGRICTLIPAAGAFYVIVLLCALLHITVALERNKAVKSTQLLVKNTSIRSGSETTFTWRTLCEKFPSDCQGNDLSCGPLKSAIFANTTCLLVSTIEYCTNISCPSLTLLAWLWPCGIMPWPQELPGTVTKS